MNKETFFNCINGESIVSFIQDNYEDILEAWLWTKGSEDFISDSPLLNEDLRSAAIKYENFFESIERIEWRRDNNKYA